jgi:hypothetical protein
MDIRNPVFTADNRIDCEIEHPHFGWIPFTADPNDVEAHGQKIYAAALAMGPADYVASAVVPPTKEEQEAARKAAYTQEADPLFFMSQRGEATVEEWQAKVAEIKARYPYPEETQA